MQPKRFLLGSLVAGVLLNTTGILLAHYVLREYVYAMIERVGDFPTWAPLSHLSMRFAFAAVGLGIWSFVRYRVSGRLAAITLTAAFAWILVSPVPLEFWHTVAGLGGRDLAIAAVWGFGELWLAIAVGSWIAGGRAGSSGE